MKATIGPIVPYYYRFRENSRISMTSRHLPVVENALLNVIFKCELPHF